MEREIQWKDLEKTPISELTLGFSPCISKREIRMWSSDSGTRHQTTSREESWSKEEESGMEGEGEVRRDNQTK